MIFLQRLNTLNVITSDSEKLEICSITLKEYNDLAPMSQDAVVFLGYLNHT